MSPFQSRQAGVGGHFLVRAITQEEAPSPSVLNSAGLAGLSSESNLRQNVHVSENPVKAAMFTISKGIFMPEALASPSRLAERLPQAAGCFPRRQDLAQEISMWGRPRWLLVSASAGSGIWSDIPGNHCRRQVEDFLIARGRKQLDFFLATRMISCRAAGGFTAAGKTNSGTPESSHSRGAAGFHGCCRQLSLEFMELVSEAGSPGCCLPGR